MANEEQLSILKQGVDVWNEWRDAHPDVEIDLFRADLRMVDLSKANLMQINLNGSDLRNANLNEANLSKALLRSTDLTWASLKQANLTLADLLGARLAHATLTQASFKQANLEGANLTQANLDQADFAEANFSHANLEDTKLAGTNLTKADFWNTDLRKAYLWKANLSGARLNRANLRGTIFSNTNQIECDFSGASMQDTILGMSDLSTVGGLKYVYHSGPSYVPTATLMLSKGKIPEEFLRGCGLSDWEIEEVKLYNPNLRNEEIDKILHKIHDLRATQALQISPLFISYSHGDTLFVDKVERYLNKKGARFWRDIHDMKAGRIEKQIDSAISQGRTVLLILSEHSLNSDWVEHEVRTAREVEKDMGRDVLCPVALDDSWKSTKWEKRLMEQILKYNILDFSEWEDDVKFEGMFRKLIDGLELFYKG